MDIKAEYYISKYEDLKVLSDTEKCKTTLVRNIDTGELAVKKEMGVPAYKIYSELKSIENRNLVKVLDCFKTEDKCIAIEEYINGKQLGSIIGETGLPVSETINYILQLGNALVDVHKRGIIHRDIQPKNIIITNEGTLKLIDFDIAREEKKDANQDTNLFGTVGYASPEQYGFAQTDCRSDIYSVGVLMREMLTGTKNGSDSGIVAKVSRENLVNNTRINGQELVDIINKCMQIDASNRYVNVESLIAHINECKGEKTEDNINELPKLTLKNIICSIPGFRKGNVMYGLLSGFLHIMFGVMMVQIGLDVKATGLWRLYGGIAYPAMFWIPYLYLANIGQIAQRFPKKKFKSKRQKNVYQVICACILFFIIGMIVAYTAPPLNTSSTGVS